MTGPVTDTSRQVSSWSLIIWAVAGIALHLLLWRISEPPALFSDFYKAYYPAGQALIEANPEAAWQRLEPGVGGFVNLPIMAWLFVPLVYLGETAAGWIFLCLGAAAMLASWLLMTRNLLGAAIAGPMLFLFLVNGPMVNSLREGNTTHIAFLLVISGFVLWKTGRNLYAGMLLALAGLIKIPLLLLGVYFLLRRNWSAVGGGVAALGVVAILSIAVHGLAANLAWYDNSVAPYLGRAVAAFNVQSVDGFMIRLTSGAEGLFDWSARDIPALHKAARLIIFTITGFAFVWITRCYEARQSAPDKQDYLELALVMMIAIVLSPISWSHYYMFFLLPFGLYLAGQLALAEDNATRWLMWSGFVLTALPVVLLPIESDRLLDAWARSGTSAHLLGGVLMLIAVLRGAARLTR
jgi:alpha-1,2-mannosyltransferase